MLGPAIAFEQNACRKSVPLDANLSNSGVGSSSAKAFWYTPKEESAWSSETMRRMFGLPFAKRQAQAHETTQVKVILVKFNFSFIVL